MAKEKLDDLEESHQQESIHDDAPPIKKSKKKRKKKKARKLEASQDPPSQLAECMQEEHITTSTQKCKKKKKKKKKRKRSSKEHHEATEGDNGKAKKKPKVEDAINVLSNDDNESFKSQFISSPLEGHMLDGKMVLLDRKARKVYSTDNGTEIGSISKEGKISLKQNESTESASDFPFETDADDHCESPHQAYQDVVPFLKDCATSSCSSQEKLLIYDPYFCNGTVVQNLKSLGFPNVYNRKEDAYQVWGSSKYPKHDVLVTNPPYSGDHIERLIDHVTSKAFGNRPWMLLLPQWVHKKDYFLARTKNIRPFYVVPKRRYVYIPPPSFRESKKSDVHKKSSPFVSMWFVWGGTKLQNERWLSTISRLVSSCDVARSKSALRDLRRKGGRNQK